MPEIVSRRQRADVSAGVAASRGRWGSWRQTQWRGRRPLPRRLGWRGRWWRVRRAERRHDDHEGVSGVGSRRKRPRQHRWGDQHANSDPEIGKHPLVDGTVYSGSKWRHIPASNRSCPNRVARRSTVTVFLLSPKLRGRGQDDVGRAFSCGSSTIPVTIRAPNLPPGEPLKGMWPAMAIAAGWPP